MKATPDIARELVLQELRRHFPSWPESHIAREIADWDITPYMDGGQVTGAGILKGFEFHFLSTPQFRIRRDSLRAQLAPLLAKHGFLTTRVRHEDQENQRFNRLFGFAPTWSDDQFQYFIMTKLPFEGKPCRQ